MPDLPPAFLRLPIAHRGLHDRASGRLENSRAAFEAAVAAGYGIELDVQQAACGTPMVFHDGTLERLTGRTGEVRELDAAALGRIPLAGSGETIPTLSEILSLVAGHVPLLIEIKDQTGRLGPDTGRLEARVVDDLESYRGPVALMSFNPHSVAALAASAPDRPRGLISCAFAERDWPLEPGRRARLAALADFDGAGAAFVSHDHRDLDNPTIGGLRARGVPVLCWTVRSRDEEEAARGRADNITFEGYRPALPD